MPEASWCRSCRDYVWVGLDGGCSKGHPRSDLQAIYEAPTAAGKFVPPPPQRPDGRPRVDTSQIDLLPQPTYRRTDSGPAAGDGEHRSSGSLRGAQIAAIAGAAVLIFPVLLGARSDSSEPAGVPGAALVHSAGQLVVQDQEVLWDASGRAHVTGTVLKAAIVRSTASR